MDIRYKLNECPKPTICNFSYCEAGIINLEKKKAIIRNLSRKEDTNMEEILRKLRNDVEKAQSTLELLEDHKSDMERSEEGLEDYIKKVEELIDTLERLPSVNVDLRINVRFDSE